MKKIIGLILTMLVICALFVSPSYAQEQTSDVARLRAFGIIMSGELEDSEAPVKRGDFARYAINMSGVSPETLVAEVPFSDITEETKNFAHIAAAYALGYMSGADNKFMPDEPITQMQAAKTMLTLLGYNHLAEELGGWEKGYAQAALSVGIFPGISNTQPLTQAQTLRLLTAVLDEEVLEYESVGNEISFKIVNRETVQTKYLKIYKGKGIVEADKYSELYSPVSRMGSKTINIGGKTYFCDDALKENMLGRYVEYYYRDEIDGEKIVHIATKDECLKIDAEDILDINLKGVKYLEGEREKLEPFYGDTVFIRNGKVTAMTEEKLKFERGFIELIDNDDDGRTDVLKVTAYTTIHVDTVGAVTKMISGKDGNNLDINPEIADIFFIKDGNETTVASVATNNILSCVISEGNGENFKKIYISSKSYSGKVDSVDVENETFTAQGNTYKMSKDVANEIFVGFEGTFYADIFGCISALSGDKDDVYGYITKVAKQNLGKVEARIFTENDRWVTLPFKKKVDVNGKVLTDVEVYDKIIETGIAQLVRYNVTSDREINKISFAKTYDAGTPEMEDAIRGDKFRLSFEASSVNYRNPIKGFGTEAAISNNAKLFFIPDAANADDERQYSIGTPAELIADALYSVKLYDADEIMVAKAAIITSLSGDAIDNGGSIQDFMVVSKITPGINADGDETYAITGMFRANEYMLYTNDKQVVDKLATMPQKGDVIQIKMNKKGYITVINAMFSPAAGNTQKFIKGGVYGASTFMAGEVLGNNTTDGLLLLNYQGNASALISTKTTGRVYIVDINTKKAIMGTINDVAKGDYIFTGMRYLQARDMIVLKDIK